MLKRNIYLLGFMGSGKSYWGRLLAKALDWSFFDLDAVIEETEKCTIKEIFASKGEAYFRTLEGKCLRNISKTTTPSIIALGGGTPCFGENMSWIQRHGISIFLNPPIHILVERLKKESEHRPLLAGKDEDALQQFIEEKLNDRLCFYKQANYIISETNSLIPKIKKLMEKNTLLLLHGALGSQKQLEPLKELLTLDFDVRTLNFTGHGGKAFGDLPFSIDLFTKDVLHYIDEQNLEQVNIFGYSMGGYVALNLAKLYPERVGKIFTLATKFAWSVETATREVKMLDPVAIESKVPAFAKALEMRHAPQDWKNHLAKTASLMLDLGNGAALSAEDFSKVQQKVVITVGSKDRMVSQEESEAIAKVIPNAHFELLEGVPHPIEKVDVQMISEKIKEEMLS